MMPIQKISLPIPGMDELHAEARQEGYSFIDTLIDQWVSGANRFERYGEILMGALDPGGCIVAVGGLTIDPFIPYRETPEIGRIRRVYVRSRWRNQGLGCALVLALADHARAGFRAVRLRAENADAARLYERIGFSQINNPDATHLLSFETTVAN